MHRSRRWRTTLEICWQRFMSMKSLCHNYLSFLLLLWDKFSSCHITNSRLVWWQNRHWNTTKRSIRRPSKIAWLLGNVDFASGWIIVIETRPNEVSGDHQRLLDCLATSTWRLVESCWISKPIHSNSGNKHQAFMVAELQFRLGYLLVPIHSNSGNKHEAFISTYSTYCTLNFFQLT